MKAKKQAPKSTPGVRAKAEPTRLVGVRLTQEEFQRLKKAAKGSSMSVVIRAALARYLAPNWC